MAMGTLCSEAALGGVSFIYLSDFFSLLEQNPQTTACLPCTRVSECGVSQDP